MTGKEKIIDGCEFQSDCIEYKDISYLKIMPICAIHKLSIACHDKVNKCKYYKLYKQLKAKEQECNKLYIQLKSDEEYHEEEENTLRKIIKNKEERNIELYKENNKLKQTLTEIKEYLIKECKICKEQCAITNEDCADCQAQEILQKISQYKGEYNEKIR